MKKLLSGLIAVSLMGVSIPAEAAMSGDVIKLGVLTDFSSVYADNSGQSSMEAVKMAVEEFGGNINGVPIEIVSADFQNKADVSMTIARRWIDQEKVDVIIDAPNSAIAIAMASLARDTDRVYLSGAVSSDITGKGCTPNSVQFAPDTYSFAAVAVRPLVERGLKNWFALTVDYALGHSMERDAAAIATANGAQLSGAIRFPFNTADFSSFLLQAGSSGADTLAFATGGLDLQNAVRQAVEFGLNDQMKLVGLSVELLDAYKIGTKVLGGLYLTEAWYWDQNGETRAFAETFMKARGKMPSRVQVATYSMTRHYLEAVKALGSDESGAAVVAKMKELPVNDVYAKNGSVREDGRLIKEMYLAQVKTPEESKGEWDLYKIVTTVPGDVAFRPASESECPLLK
ncbi:ABC transporter substrate-binding protein [Mesorhizobium sp. 1B3]|uniref:ABC transporter substrate-binding protein n=1 Tax=Mesorhizobium sp. 1B3 TaxID=3243599 RepID=UPI003D97D9EB